MSIIGRSFPHTHLGAAASSLVAAECLSLLLVLLFPNQNKPFTHGRARAHTHTFLNLDIICQLCTFLGGKNKHQNVVKWKSIKYPGQMPLLPKTQVSKHTHALRMLMTCVLRGVQISVTDVKTQILKYQKVFPYHQQSKSWFSCPASVSCTCLHLGTRDAHSCAT